MRVNFDTSDRKIGAFISTWVTLIFAGLTLFLCLDLGQTINGQSGVEALSQIVLLPILLVLYFVVAALTVSSVINSIISLFSTVKVIKVISILLLLISLGALGLEIYTLTLIF